MANNRTEAEKQEKREARRAARQTAEKKAARKERSQEYTKTYATDADRALINNRGTAARRGERRDVWNKDGFDLNTFGNQHVSGQEMKEMRTSGRSSSEIEEMTAGMHMTDRATKQLNRKKAREKAVAVRNAGPVEGFNPAPVNEAVREVTTPNTPGTPTAPLQPGTTTPKPTTWDPMPTPEPGVTTPTMPTLPPRTPTGPTIIGDTGDVGKTGDMTTTIGDGNTIIGSPIGNDYSVTIGNTGNMGGSGGGGLSNMMGAAAYSALNNNLHYKSQGDINGYGRAAGASANAELRTGATDRVANLYNMVGQSQQYWNNKAIAHQGTYLGDVGNIGGYSFVQAPNPVQTEDRTSEIFKDDNDD